MTTAVLSLHTCFSGTELADLEAFLARQPGVRSASIDRTRSQAHVSYDPSVTGVDRLCEMLNIHGYACDGEDHADSGCQPGHPAAGGIDTSAAGGAAPAASSVGGGPRC